MEIKINKEWVDEAVQKAVEELKEQNIWIPKGLTNGEVFQAIFPCDEVHVNGLQEGCVHFSMKSNPDSMDCFSLEWWDRPYQEGGEK